MFDQKTKKKKKKEGKEGGNRARLVPRFAVSAAETVTAFHKRDAYLAVFLYNHLARLVPLYIRQELSSKYVRSPPPVDLQL